MDDELRYSKDALLNRVFFLSANNEVNVFVEDEGKEYEYETIFTRLFDDIDIFKFFPMGGKPGVEKAFEEYGEKFEGKYNFYIVDGDFDLILDKRMIDAPNYIYLERYNIESYYVDKEAVLGYMRGKLKKVRGKVQQNIEYDIWEEDTYKKLERLFLVYVVVQKICPDRENVGISQYTYIDEDGFIDEDKIFSYESLISREADYSKRYLEYEERYRSLLNGDSKRLICGKYIISSLVRYLRNKTSKSFKEDDFKYFLINEFDVKQLDYIREKINRYI